MIGRARYTSDSWLKACTVPVPILLLSYLQRRVLIFLQARRFHGSKRRVLFLAGVIGFFFRSLVWVVCFAASVAIRLGRGRERSSFPRLARLDPNVVLCNVCFDLVRPVDFRSVFVWFRRRSRLPACPYLRMHDYHASTPQLFLLLSYSYFSSCGSLRMVWFFGGWIPSSVFWVVSVCDGSSLPHSAIVVSHRGRIDRRMFQKGWGGSIEDPWHHTTSKDPSSIGEREKGEREKGERRKGSVVVVGWGYPSHPQGEHGTNRCFLSNPPPPTRTPHPRSERVGERDLVVGVCGRCNRDQCLAPNSGSSGPCKDRRYLMGTT